MYAKHVMFSAFNTFAYYINTLIRYLYGLIIHLFWSKLSGCNLASQNEPLIQIAVVSKLM